MFVRVIFLTIIVIVLVYLYKRLRRPSIAAPKQGYTDTVTCAHCGLTLPKEEALAADGKHYCCQEHIPK